jgi:DNA repair ATPase RecN
MENEKLFELMEKMYIELQDIKKEVKSSSDKIDGLDKKAYNLEKNVLRMEQDHGKKLEALFDGYKQNSEQLNGIEKKYQSTRKLF